MKSTRKYLLAVCALAIGFAAPAIQAEEGATPPPHKKEGGPRGDRVAMLKEKLGLTDEQTAQIKKIFADEKEAIMALRDKELEPKERRAEMEKIRDSIRTQVDAVLTAEQKAKFAELRKKHERGPGAKGEGLKGPPPEES
ncbi:MAG: hypothetical protein K0R17_3690 [Rariglobus sp.]|jgi:Spy/CpxP family protein refolding chaperone|nr:hypothetical protein [Rariglobus sp.]